MSIKQRKEEVKAFKIELSLEEDAYVTEQADRQKISKRKYAKYKLLDTTVGINELSDQIMREMPEYYNLVKQINDDYIRKTLMEMGDRLCLSLK